MIRDFNINDLDKIMKIWLEENIKAHNFISKEYWLSNYEFVKSVLPNANIYIYDSNNAIYGFLGMNENYIEGIFVKSDYHNQGIGTALLNKAKQDNSELKLKVYKKNVNAIEFYKKKGFEITEESTDTQTNESEYTMIWRK